jgi:hypothetical protein
LSMALFLRVKRGRDKAFDAATQSAHHDLVFFAVDLRSKAA